MMSEEMYESPKFKKHAAGVVGTVNTAVNMLGPDLSPLVDVLKALGKKHVKYGVVEAHYAVVGQALIETLDAAMSDKFTADVKAAWLEIWGIISSTMIAGADY
jgi:hemoglobin-like flavoprotein